jgi:hypothetical protein
VRRLQAPELQHDEEQEEDDGADRVQQVLPLLPEAYGAQRDEVIDESTNLRIDGLGLPIQIRKFVDPSIHELD